MNPNKIDLNLLFVFDALLRTQSTTLAAQELHLTQSAISNALKRLRFLFEDPLFVKGGRGMVPTAFALEVAQPVRGGLDLIRMAVTARASFDPATSDRGFRIYMNELGQTVLMPRLLAAIADDAPAITLTSVELAPNEASAAMEAGEIDFAFGHISDLKTSFHRQLLFEEHYVALVRKSHSRIREQLTLRDFFDAKHVAYHPAWTAMSTFEDAVDRLFEEHGEYRKVALRLAYSLGLAGLLEAADVLVCVPSLLAGVLAQTGNLRIFQLPFDSPVFRVSLLWHERNQADSGHLWLRERIQRLFISEFT